MQTAWLEVMCIAALALSAGCSTSKDALRDDAPPSCETLQTSARMTVQQAIERDSNRACQVASDCVAVAFQASCFDSCSRVVAKTAVAAVQAAIDDVDAHACAQAHDAGCAVVIPPCVPPAEISCNAGLCQ